MAAHRGRAERRVMRPRSSLLRGLLWTAPWWLGFLFFLAAPMAYSLYISFCDYSMLQPPVLTGARNYQALLEDATFGVVVRNTLIFAAICVPLATVLAILLAVLLNQRVRGQAFFRAAVFVPTIVPLVVAGLVWMWLLNPSSGLVNHVLGAVGIAGPAWLNDPTAAMATVVLISLWLVGTPVVIYLAGIQDIPEELYEAARLDGAGAARRLWHVTLPGISAVILFNVVVGLINALQIFALPYVIWRGERGPQDATYFYTSYLYDNAFRFLKMGYASAMAWVQLLIVLLLTGLVFWASRRMVHYRGA